MPADQLGRADASERRPSVADGTDRRTGPMWTSGGTMTVGGTLPMDDTPGEWRAYRRQGGCGARVAGCRVGRADRVVT